MKNPTNSWPSTQRALNVRLFAQQIMHQSDIATHESFRMDSLNSLSRLREAQTVIKNIQGGRPKETFIPLKEELVWSLATDLAIPHAFMSKAKSYRYFIDNLDLKDLDQTLSQLRVVEAYVSPDYKRSVEHQLREAVNATPEGGLSELDRIEFARQNYERISRLTSLYLTIILSDGYSREFVAHQATLLFFKKDKAKIRLSLIDSFLSSFDGREHEFTVYFGSTSTLSFYLEGANVGEVQDVASLRASVANLLAADVLAGNDIVAVRAKAKDIFAAARSVSELLTSYVAVAGVRSVDLELPDVNRFVASTKGGGLVVEYDGSAFDPGMSRRVRRAQRSAVNNVLETTSRLFDRQSHLERASRERVLNCASLAYKGLNSPSVDLQLTSFWSALETLLPPPNGGASSRISHYSSFAVPAVSLWHHRRAFVYVSNLLLNLNGIGYRKIIRQALSRMTELQSPKIFEGLIAVVCLEEMEDVRGELYDFIHHNPLATHAVCRLESKYGQVDRLKAAFDQHEKKVSWQLSRIYRARNAVVHAGANLRDHDSLSISAFEYVSAALFQSTASHYLDLGHTRIDDIFVSISMDYQILKEVIKRNASAKLYDRGLMIRLFEM